MHKNNAGSLCAFTIFYFLLDVKKLNVIVRLGVVLAAGYFLYRTNSKTSLSLTIMCVLTAGIFCQIQPILQGAGCFFSRRYLFSILVGLLYCIRFNTYRIRRSRYASPDVFQIWLPLLEYSPRSFVVRVGVWFILGCWLSEYHCALCSKFECLGHEFGNRTQWISRYADTNGNSWSYFGSARNCGRAIPKTDFKRSAESIRKSAAFGLHPFCYLPQFYRIRSLSTRRDCSRIHAFCDCLALFANERSID